jgi:iron complex outermembrane recepter protein
VKANRRVYCAVAAILGAHAAAANAAAPAEATPAEPESGLALSEVVVTAQRREQSAQDVPIQMQALTAETIKNLAVTTFDDYVKFLPNVSVSSQGPGLGQIYMRGLATTQDGEQSSGATGSFPNVAVYLDEQSAQLPGRNLDIYAADIERIEVLEGPQGTLFGAGAQAGVIRYITNKPKLNTTEAIFNAGYGTTAHGAHSSNLDATLNIPLIPDRLSARAVIYNETRGGYIDNVPATFKRANTDVGIVDYFNTVSYGHAGTGQVPALDQSANNSAIAGKDINPVTYKGIRASVLFQITDDWNALFTQSYQNMEADGVFSQMPVSNDGVTKLPDLSAEFFSPSYDKDKFTNTAWTFSGRIAMLKAVYTGGYLVRNVEQVADYTNYTRGVYADYYACILPGSTQAKNLGIPGGQCFSPVSSFHVIQKNIHQNHEFRLSTPDDWRVRAIGGLFWENFVVNDQSDWGYKAPEAGFTPLIPPAGAGVNNPNVRNSVDAFYDDVRRGYKQKAAFASVDFDIIPKRLTITGGTRWYQMDTYETGAKQGSFDCRPGGLYAYTPGNIPGACDTGLNLDTYKVPAGNAAYSDSAVGLKKRYDGFKSRANLSWKVTDDALLYYTWSQGFRPGGFNRSSGFVSNSKSPLNGIFLTPIGFKPDTLTNNEIGWKTEWLDHRVQFNGAVYREDWKDVQISLFDPGVLGNLTFTTNGPNYRVKGLESEVNVRVTHEFTISASASWNHSELVNTPTLLGQDGKPINFATLGLANPYGQTGSPLAQSPPFQGSIRGRYEFNLGDYDAFVQVIGTRRAHSLSTTDKLRQDFNGNSVAYDMPGYSTMDASIGIAKDAWNVQLYGTNLTDTRGIVYSTFTQWIKQDTVIRPRTLSLRFGYKFSSQ